MAKSKQKEQARVKKMLWQSIRIFKKGGFSIPELLMTAPGATIAAAKYFVRDLERHGIVKKVGGVAVEKRHQRYRLIKERESVKFPTVCTVCGNPLHRKCFFLAPKKETETEREPFVPTVLDGKARVAEMVQTVQSHFSLPLPAERGEARHEVPEELKQRLERKLNGEEEVHDDAA